MAPDMIFSSFPLQLGYLLIPLALFLLIISSFLIKHAARRRKLLPPGPTGLPIIGNLHQLGKNLHNSLWDMAKAHGPLVYLRLGRVPTLVVSSADAAMEILKTHDLAFCNRFPIGVSQKYTYGYINLALSPYGDYYRKIKKFCMLELLNTRRVQSMGHIREDEVGTLVRVINDHGQLHTPVNLSEMFFCLMNNITARSVFGKRCVEGGECVKSPFEELVLEFTTLLGTITISDFLPGLRWLNKLTGLQARIDRNFGQMDAFLEEMIESHLISDRSHNREQKQNDLVDVILQSSQDSNCNVPLTRNQIKAILSDLFVAGIDTTATLLEWAMTLLMRHPNVMKKAQTEIRGLLGAKDKIEESDLQQLTYLKLVIKETLRFHPPGALLIPRFTREACTVCGYTIPEGTLVLVHAQAISKDPKYWDNPNQFFPERFVNNSVDFRGRDFQFIPFGAGRRGCPGISMGLASAEVTLANLLHKFDWKLPDGMTADMFDVEETDGPIIHKKSPLRLIAKPWKALLK